MEDAFLRLARAFKDAGVRYVLIGVAGANYYAPAAAAAFVTQDRDLLLPLDPANVLRAWETVAGLGLALWSGDEPLDEPRDLVLATAIVARRALVRAVDDTGALQVDLTLEMAGFDFESVWTDHRDGQAFMAIGMHDAVLGPPVMQRLARTIRGCSVAMELPDAGHFVQESGEEVAMRALAYCREGPSVGG